MKTKILPLIFLTFLSCSQHRVNEPKITDEITSDTLVIIDLERNLTNLKEVNLSQISDSVRYIQLETLPESHIGKILNYQVYPELILVNCLTDVFLFDNSGQFLKKIGNRGMGPNEFVYADWVDYSNDTIVISTRKKLLFFSKNGEFLYKATWTKETGHICLLSNDRVALNLNNPYGNEFYRLALLNRDGDSVKFFKTTETYNLHPSTKTQLSSFEQHFYRQHSKVFYRESYNDTIFRISSNNCLVPVYHIKLGKYKIPIEHRLEYLNDEKKFANLGANYLTFRVEESDHYLFLNYHSRNKGLGNYSSGFSLYNKTSEELTAIGHKKFSRFQLGFFNDLDGGVTFIPDATMSDGGNAYKLLYPFELKKFIQSEDFKRSPVVESKKKLFEVFVNTLSENANPVIMVVKLK